MSQMYFTTDHEWLRVDGDVAVVGITDYAQEQLGDVVFVELPDVGASFDQADEAAVVESVKAASEIYAPASGEVVAVNNALADAPETANSDPLGEGWFFSLRLSESSQLDDMMNEAGYAAFVDGLDD